MFLSILKKSIFTFCTKWLLIVWKEYKYKISVALKNYKLN